MKLPKIIEKLKMAIINDRSLIDFFFSFLNGSSFFSKLTRTIFFSKFKKSNLFFVDFFDGDGGVLMGTWFDGGGFEHDAKGTFADFVFTFVNVNYYALPIYFDVFLAVISVHKKKFGERF